MGRKLERRSSRSLAVWAHLACSNGKCRTEFIFPFWIGTGTSTRLALRTKRPSTACSSSAIAPGTRVDCSKLQFLAGSPRKRLWPMKANRFFDPLYGRVAFTDSEGELLFAPEVQRLRFIRM